ncbi:MAG: SidJ-related pseudokinase, partial [Pseudomonadota bacterium]
LGSLPLSVNRTRPPADATAEPVRVSWDRLLSDAKADPGRATDLRRSVVVPAENGRRLLWGKFARAGEDPAGLVAEAGWMEFLRENRDAFSSGFLVPRPLCPGRSRILQVTGLSVPGLDPGGLHPKRLAVAFFAHPGYFTYPNEEGRLLPAERFVRVMGKNARILGRMAGAGVIHTAAIPLFHNRVQQHRRADRGLYHWPRAGRLDQWLASCRHPNLGITGPRDFEHLEAYSGNRRELYIHAGNQILAMALVAGSWFRNQAPDRRGPGPDGQPADTRDLFDPGLLARMLEAILDGWCRGFSGAPAPDLPVDCDRVARAMIEQMGVDRDMAEVLRVHDQQRLSNVEFTEFLASRGHTGPATRGEADITLITGPHLGGFNQRISVPELIEFTATATGISMAQRFLRGKRAVTWATEEAA